MHIITYLWKFELNRSSKLRDNIERKTPISHEVVCFQMLDFETSNSISEVSKSNSWTNTSFSKIMSLQREPFLTMCYTINLSPLLDRHQLRFYANNYFELLPKVSTAVKYIKKVSRYVFTRTQRIVNFSIFCTKICA